MKFIKIELIKSEQIRYLNISEITVVKPIYDKDEMHGTIIYMRNQAEYQSNEDIESFMNRLHSLTESE